MSSKENYPLFDAYFEYVKDTEPPLIFHRWSMLCALGAWLGRQYHMPFGDFRIFPNMYVKLIGNPGTRKSTAIKLARKILSDTGYNSFAGDRTSKEKFLLDLAGETEESESKTSVSSLMMENLFGKGTGGTAKEVFVAADEFNDFIGTGNLDFISLLGSLWDWDDENRTFEQRFKNSKSIQIFQPTVSILGGNTHVGLANCFPPQAIGQGFMSRLMLIYSEPSGVKITFPKRPSEDLKEKLRGILESIRGTVIGEAVLDKSAVQALDILYRKFNGLDDIRFQHYSTRRFTHLLKLCLLCSAARLSTEITQQDVVMANTILSFAEHYMPQALGEFGKAKNADVADKIISILTDTDDVVRDSEIWEKIRTDLENVEMMQKMLAGLQMAGKIQFIGDAGAKHRGWTVVKKVLQTKALFIDYELLVEAPESMKGFKL